MLRKARNEKTFDSVLQCKTRELKCSRIYLYARQMQVYLRIFTEKKKDKRTARSRTSEKES